MHSKWGIVCLAAVFAACAPVLHAAYGQTKAKTNTETLSRTIAGEKKGLGGGSAYTDDVPIKFEAGAKIKISVQVTGEGRVVGLILRDSDGNQIKASTTQVGNTELEVGSIPDTGEYTLIVATSLKGPYKAVIESSSPIGVPGDPKQGVTDRVGQDGLAARVENLERKVAEMEKLLREIKAKLK